MKHYTLEDFPQMDSLYRLVNIAAKRANQISKPETRALVRADSRKPTIIALEEILNGKVTYRAGESGEDDFEVS
jgi:DNA-directed RNA polymerase omega subunit